MIYHGVVYCSKEAKYTIVSSNRGILRHEGWISGNDKSFVVT